jgi:isopentenyl-diphosphate delta-isomerase
MSTDYLQQKIYIPRVDQNDNVLGKVERWKAHEEGILHRAFTVCLYVGDRVLLQHRKHPVFDGFFDLTCSSHPLFIDGSPQELEEAVQTTLKREWGIVQSRSPKVSHTGQVLYKATDKQYIEHEVCHLFTGELTSIPTMNPEVAYGYTLLDKDKLLDTSAPIRQSLAPWVLPLLDLL